MASASTGERGAVSGRASDRRPRSSGCRPGWRPGGRDVAVLVAAWIAVVVALTWPLAAHLSTRLPDIEKACRFDALLAAWAAAWETDALLQAPSRLLDANVYHPAPKALLYVETGFGALPLFAPAYLATRDPAFALNATFLLGAAFTAAALHLVVGTWTGSFVGGLLAAWTLLTTRWLLWSFGPTAPNYAVLFWFPAILLLAARGPRRGIEQAALVVIVALQGLVSAVYLAAATFAPLVVLAAVRLARRPTRSAGRRLAASLLAALLLLSPLYAALVGLRRANPDLERQTVWQVVEPTRLPLGPLSGSLSPLAIPPVAWLLVAAGLLVHLGRRRRGPLREVWRHGALWLSVGFLASLAREIEWDGVRHPGPLALLGTVLPQVMVLRVPSRIAIAAAMGVALLVGTAHAEIERLLVRKLRPAAATAAIAAIASGLVVSMYLVLVRGLPAGPDSLRRMGFDPPAALPPEYPTAPAILGDSPLIARLRSSGRPLLEVGDPTENAYLSVVEPQARAMYRSIFHRSPILNGYGSFWPPGHLERMVLAREAPNPGVLGRLSVETGLAHVLVHGAGLAPSDRRRWLESPEARLVASDGDDLLFDVIETPVSRTPRAAAASDGGAPPP